MYRTALRSSPGAVRALRAQNVVAGSRRFLTTGPADKKRTWKGAALRWGLAIGAVYFYNTSAIFSDEPPASTYTAPPQFSDSELSTVDAIIAEKRRKTLAAAPPLPPPAKEQAEPKTETAEAAVVQAETETETQTAPEPGSPEALEQEAGQQGAFNPETGEINWDCPCLGGMAHGPCGEEFKAAFSCFVYSKEEPKGMECIDRFQHMQDCFRQYPDVYGAELADDAEEEGAVPASAPEGAEDVLAKAQSEEPAAAKPTTSVEPKAITENDGSEQHQELKKVLADESPVPKEAFDATSANKGKEQ